MNTEGIHSVSERKGSAVANMLEIRVDSARIFSPFTPRPIYVLRIALGDMTQGTPRHWHT